MSAPAAPSLGASTGAIARLTWLRTLRGRKLVVAAIATAVVVLFPAVVAVMKDGEDATGVLRSGIDWGFYRLLVFLLPVLFTSGAVSEEVEGRTLHFLAMRPLPRASIALGKYAVSMAASLAVLWLGLVLLHGISLIDEPTPLIEQLGATARAGGALSLLLLTYGAICLFWGVLVPEAGGMLSVVWLGFFEWFGMLLPGVFRFASMNHFARELGGLERAGWDVIRNPLTGAVIVEVPDVEAWICATAIGGELVVFLGFALLIMHTAQLRFGKG